TRYATTTPVSPGHGSSAGKVNSPTSRRVIAARPVTRDRAGEGGIRTRDALPRTAFPVRRHSPLGDLSEDARVAGPDAAEGRSGGAGEGSRGVDATEGFRGEVSPRRPRAPERAGLTARERWRGAAN